jgi:hypothetical protein
MRRQIVVLVGLGLLACCAGISSAQVVVTVPATSGPWQWTHLYWESNAVVNASYPYAEVIPTAFAPTTPPVIVSSSSEIPFTPGDILTFNYRSGQITGAYDRPWWDANGNTEGGEGSPRMYGADNYGRSPGYYVLPVGGALVNFMELVGTFTDTNGAVVGAPYVIGDTCSLTIPIGATQFQLGFNDDNYPDNSGSVSMGVSEAVPEPGSLILLGAGAICLLAYAWPQRKRMT